MRIKRLFSIIISHKVISLAVLLFLGGTFYFIKSSFFVSAEPTRYVLTTVKKETITLSVSGSGQVLALSQVDLKPKASGDIIFVGMKNGDEVKAGALLIQIDSREAQKSVRDAQTSLESAKLSYEKLIQPTDPLTILQAENSLIEIKNSKLRHEDNLKKSYEDGFNNVSNAFLDLPSIISGLNDILLGTSFNSVQTNMDYYSSEVKMYDQKVLQYQDDAYKLYQKARASYDKNFENYKALSRFSPNEAIEALISQTYDTTKDIAEAVKSANNLIQFYKDKLLEKNLKPRALADTHLSQLNNFTGKTNSHLLNLLNIKRTIEDSKQNIESAIRSIEEKTASLEKLKKGPDPLDIESQKLSLKQRENALRDAQEKLSDYYLYSPFSGIITKMNAKKGDTISANSVVAVLVSPQRMAEITLNEVDVSKVKIGQKAVLTFDAIPELSITGHVAEIDAIGTQSQGVVSYNIKISFDTQDDRIKPGMTVTANIITDVKPEAIAIPNSALISQNNSYFVEIPAIDKQDNQNVNQNLSRQSSSSITLKNPPRRQQVEIGIANDEYTEIISGLKDGDIIIANTIKQSNNTSGANRTLQPSSPFRIPGFGGGFR